MHQYPVHIPHICKCCHKIFMWLSPSIIIPWEDFKTVPQTPIISPPYFHTNLRQKWGGGICWLFDLSRAYAPPSIPQYAQDRQSWRLNATAFWKNGSFNERVLQKISGTCVHTNTRGIEATCIVSGDRKRPHVNASNKKLADGQQTRLDLDYV